MTIRHLGTVAASTLLLFASLCHKAVAFEVRNIEFIPSVAISQVYDSNVTYTEDVSYTDWISNISLGLRGQYEGRVDRFEMGGKITESLYWRNEDFTHFAQDLNARYEHDFAKLGTVSVSDEFYRSEQPRQIEDEFGSTVGRYLFTRNRINLGHLKNLSKRWNVEFRYLNEILERESGLSDSVEHQVGGATNFAYSSATTFRFSYDYKYRVFDEDDSARFNRLAATIRHYLQERLYVEGKSGVDVIRSFQGETIARPNFSAGLVSELNERSVASLRFEKKYDAEGSQQDLFNSWRLTANVTHQLAERARLSVSGFYGEGEFVQSHTKDELLGIRTGLEYDIRENFKMILAYSLTRQDSNDSNRQYLKNLITLGGQYEF